MNIYYYFLILSPLLAFKFNEKIVFSMSGSVFSNKARLEKQFTTPLIVLVRCFRIFFSNYVTLVYSVIYSYDPNRSLTTSMSLVKNPNFMSSSMHISLMSYYEKKPDKKSHDLYEINTEAKHLLYAKTSDETRVSKIIVYLKIFQIKSRVLRMVRLKCHKNAGSMYNFFKTIVSNRIILLFYG